MQFWMFIKYRELVLSAEENTDKRTGRTRMPRAHAVGPGTHSSRWWCEVDFCPAVWLPWALLNFKLTSVWIPALLHVLTIWHYLNHLTSVSQYVHVQNGICDNAHLKGLSKIIYAKYLAKSFIQNKDSVNHQLTLRQIFYVIVMLQGTKVAHFLYIINDTSYIYIHTDY